MQVDLVTELEEKLPSVRLYFYNKIYVLRKLYGKVNQLLLFQGTNFDNKVKAVKDSEGKKADVFEKYQVTGKF